MVDSGDLSSLEETSGGVLHARVRAAHLGWPNTAAAGSLLTQLRAGHLFIPLFSRELVPQLIAMLLMMALALSLARLSIIPSSSAPVSPGKNPS